MPPTSRTRAIGRRGLPALALGLALASRPVAAGMPEDRLARLAGRLAAAAEAELRRVEDALRLAAAGLEPLGGGPVPIPLLDRMVRRAAAVLGRPVLGFDARLALLADSRSAPGALLPASPAAGLAAEALEAAAPRTGPVPDGLGLALPISRPGGGPAAGALLALLAPEALAAALAPLLDGEAVATAALVAEPAGEAARVLAWLREGPAPGAMPAIRQPLGAGRGLAVVVTAEPAAPPAPAPRRDWRLLGLLPLAGAIGAVGALLAARRLEVTPGFSERQARRALAELRAICDTIPVGLALLDAKGRVLSVNARLSAFAGLPADAMPGRMATEVLPPPLAETLAAAHAAVLREGRPVLDSPVAVEAGGMLRHTRNLLLSAHPVRDGQGRIEGVSATLQDVTERARAEAGRDLLVRELNHRVKNCLVTVQTLAQQTLRNTGGDPAEFARSFTERLRALSRAHDLLTVHAWGETDLLAVARAALGPWLEDRRVALEAGPPALLRPAQAQALVLAFHELATNAAKHGALTREEGRLSIGWTMDAEGMVTLRWTERGGPTLERRPERRGFGMRLLEQALRHDLGPGARPDLAFEPAGLRASITFRPGAVIAQRVAA